MTRNSKSTVFKASLAALLWCSACFADTFTHRQTNEVLHGYATGRTENDKTVVYTQEKGVLELNLDRWNITADRLGRNNKVVVLTVDGQIMLEIQTEALLQAVAKAFDEGPLFILLQIDTPGGRIDHARRICSAITQAHKCPVVAFINGGKHSGAISSGAALALACDEIYMVENSIIGAAALLALSKSGPTDLKEIYGEEIGEKVSSVWRTYLASLAQQKHRPALLAGAMVDRDVEVIEVAEADKKLFIDPADKTPQQQLVHTWSKRGSLLTLTAEQAVDCRIADKIVASKQQILRLLDAEDAEIVQDNAFQEAGKKFKRAKLRFNKLTRSLDLKIKQMKQAPTRHRALRLLRDIKREYESLLALAKLYPDLKVSIALLQRQINTAEALYEETKMRR